MPLEEEDKVQQIHIQDSCWEHERISSILVCSVL